MLSVLDKKLINLYQLIKDKKNIILSKFLEPLADIGVSADLLSVIGLTIGIASAIFMHFSRILFLSFWLLARIFDIFDGTLAQLNKKKVFKSIDVDHLCDNILTIVFFVSSIPIIGVFLPIITTLLYIIHIKMDINLKGKTIFAPRGDYSQLLFLLGKFKTGMILQILFTILSFILIRLANRKNYRT